MNRAIEWFAKNPVAANLLMVLIVAAGFVTAFSIKKEVFPEFDLDQINITVPYLGASPAEVEEAVCVRIEEAIQGIDGIKQVTSTASEGSGRVNVELEWTDRGEDGVPLAALCLKEAVRQWCCLASAQGEAP